MAARQVNLEAMPYGINFMVRDRDTDRVAVQRKGKYLFARPNELPKNGKFKLCVFSRSALADNFDALVMAAQEQPA